MRDFRELNQQVNEVKRMLNSFIQKLRNGDETNREFFISARGSNVSGRILYR